MKKRILFVDDEINILKGLNRSLRPFSKKWDMEFAEGGQNALNLLKKKSFDVIVSDMRMPEMDGAALLKIVQDEYPRMVRIILSGYSEMEVVMNSIKSVHQYLSKPCQTDTLIRAITRASTLQDFLDQDAMLGLLGGIEAIPSLPALYLQIVDELNSTDASVKSVGNIIEKDMGMTAKVLQLVNSSFFGMPSYVSKARDAVSFLGIDVVKTLVLVIELFSPFDKSTLSLIGGDDIHEHCLRTGAIAKEIATIEKMDKNTIESVIMASILHDLGKLILAQYFRDQYKKVLFLAKEKGLMVCRAEKEIFKVSHAEIGAYLLRLWGFPNKIVEGIAYHHEPARLESNVLEICGIVHVADQIDRKENPQFRVKEKIGRIDIQYLDSLGLTERLPLWQDCLSNI